MKPQHAQLANGKWTDLFFLEQMANIGSEVIRASKWKQKGNQEYSKQAFYRALELLSYSMDDKKNKFRLKEIARIYETLVDFFDGDNIYQSSDDSYQKQFHSFTYAANLSRRSRSQ
jgi:hypothetical protein